MKGKILICRYNSICEPDVMAGFQRNGYEVEQFTEVMDDPDYDVVYLKKLSQKILKDSYDFVFSINFFPVISQLCNALHLPYVCWVVDAPLFLLNAPEVRGEYNRIFLFDRALYQQYRERNPQGIFHLPLAADIKHLQEAVLESTPADRYRFGKEVAFVGSLYTEKNVYNRIKNMPDALEKSFEEMIAAQLKEYDSNLLEKLLTPELLEAFFQVVSLEAMPQGYQVDRKRFVLDEYLAVKVTENYRIGVLNKLAEKFMVSVYTESDITPLKGVLFCQSAESRQEMPKIFHYSKINLNPTAKGIRSGISQRVWDVLGAGGFLLCNPQPEVLEVFKAGAQLEVYRSLEELTEKTEYYLTHPEERKKIAQGGLYMVEKYHTYEKRVAKLLEIVRKSFSL